MKLAKALTCIGRGVIDLGFTEDEKQLVMRSPDNPGLVYIQQAVTEDN